MDNELRQLQLTQLEILKVIDAICKKNNIKYSLYAGTLLGAVRHQGFIPWDDDLDICMSRKNYNKFIKVWNKENPVGYLLQDKNNSPNYTQSFLKIRKKHTTFLQDGEPATQYHIGIFVDVFPIDRMPKKGIDRLLFQIECILYQLYTKGYTPTIGSKVEKIISKLFLSVVPKSKYKIITAYLYKKIIRHNRNNKNHCVAIETLSTIITPLPVTLMNTYENIKFEDGDFMCFKQWDEYLTLKFGDYMKLPPEDERKPLHKPKIVDFENDYFEHIQKYVK